jgi:hypothetical protein
MPKPAVNPLDTLDRKCDTCGQFLPIDLSTWSARPSLDRMERALPLDPMTRYAIVQLVSQVRSSDQVPGNILWFLGFTSSEIDANAIAQQLHDDPANKDCAFAVMDINGPVVLPIRQADVGNVRFRNKAVQDMIRRRRENAFIQQSALEEAVRSTPGVQGAPRIQFDSHH